MDDNAILNVGAGTNIEGRSFIGTNGSTGCDVNIILDANIADEVTKRVDISRGAISGSAKSLDHGVGGAA